MFLMTARVSKRRLIAAAAGIAAVIAGLVFFLRQPDAAPASAAPSPVQVQTNEKRVKFLRELGWDVAETPKESMQIRIPRDGGEVFARYNELQKSQGYDLSLLAGKTVMRYVYEIRTDGESPLLATLLVHRDRVVGGDVTDTAPDGKIRGLARASEP